MVEFLRINDPSMPAGRRDRRVSEWMDYYKQQLAMIEKAPSEWAINDAKNSISLIQEMFDAAGIDLQSTLDSYVKPTNDAIKANHLKNIQEKERIYDNANNEGAEGYNPYRHGSVPTYKAWR